ncbi:MAG: hypothetical protein Q8K64_13745 [Sediminibacterium sp.]|nr:hypothetical protein [Sediminibacterium sp.]
MKWLKRFFLQVVIILITLELFSIIAIEIFNSLELYRSNYPTYIDKIRGKKNYEQLHVVDINNDFGVWHENNKSFIHKSPCFTTTYYFNSYGARDFNRNKLSDKDRAMFIGDSFTEGYGVDSSKRFSNLVEKETGLECLNFGVSGDFGTTQFSILYKKFAVEFDHKYLFIGLFPKNDFIDDDYSFAKTNFGNRYRPYYIPENDSIVYYKEHLSESSWNPKNTNFLGSTNTKINFNKVFTNINYSVSLFEKIIRHSYSVQLILRIANAIRTKIAEKRNISYYYNFTNRNIAILDNSLSRVLNVAKTKGVKKVILFSIPYIGDFQIRKSTNTVSPLNNELDSLCAKYKIEYVDLLEEFSKRSFEPKTLYLSCNGHFSEYGNKLTSEILVKHLKE